MNVVDSSGWLEFFADAGNADFFTAPIQDTPSLVVPTLSLYEVFKKITRERGEGDALQAVAVMQQGSVVDLSVSLSLEAARLSLEHRLPMADSIILATARSHGATLWTQDADFEGIEGVRYIEKQE